MTDAGSDRVESSLAFALRQYLSTEPNKYISEDENLTQLCRWLGRWLQGKLADSEEWGKYRSVDDIVPCTANRVAPNELLLQGLLVWFGDTNRGEWKEPVSAALRVTNGTSGLLGYNVQIGDADRGLGKSPYETPHEYPYVPVEHWLFTFAGGT